MHGEIMVMEVMDRATRLRAWQERQSRDAEWAALKQWWNAEEKVRTASDELQLKHAVAYRAQTARMYQAELGRAWPKWAMVQRDRAARRSAQRRHHPTAVRRSGGLQAPGIHQ